MTRSPDSTPPSPTSTLYTHLQLPSPSQTMAFRYNSFQSPLTLHASVLTTLSPVSIPNLPPIPPQAPAPCCQRPRRPYKIRHCPTARFTHHYCSPCPQPDLQRLPNFAPLVPPDHHLPPPPPKLAPLPRRHDCRAQRPCWSLP